MDVSTLIQHLLNGLTNATLIALIAVGITLVFGLTGMVNFAHGEFMMVGGFAVYFLVPDGGILFVAALLAAMLVVGLLSMATDRILFRRTFERPINGFIISLGLILILQNTAILQYGVRARIVDPLFTGVFEVAGARASIQRIFAVVVALVLLAGMYAVLQRTTFGLMLRATAVDREVAGLMGVNYIQVITVTFLFGGLLAGAAGALMATLAPITPLIGQNFVVKGIAVAVVGGLGSVTGALAAAGILGIAEIVVGATVWAEWASMSTFLVMILVLLVRPQGIFRGVEGSSVR